MTRDIRFTSLILALLALCFYAFTMAPTFGWGDSADLAMRMVYHGDATFLNTSRDYPFFRSIGALFQLLPFGDVGTRANFMAAFFGAVSVGLVAFIGGTITRNYYAAWAAGISLMVAHSFWLMAATAEVYTFNATLVFACYACIAVWWRTQRPVYILAAAFCCGLALLHHATGIVLAATIAPLLLMRLRSLPLWAMAAAPLIFFAASFPYWQHLIPLVLAGKPLLQAMELQSPENAFFVASPLRELLKFGAYATYNFLGFGILFAIYGGITAWRRRYFEMLPAALWAAIFVFAGVTSSIPDKFNIYVLVYPVLAIFIGIGAAQMEESLPKFIALVFLLAVIPPSGYATTVYVAKELHLDLVGARTVPYRDNDWYFLFPSKRGDFGPRRYAEEALQAVDKKGFLIADYTLWRPLYVLQAVEGVRSDVTLVWEEKLMRKGVVHFIHQIPCKRSVFLATDTPPEYYQLADVKKHFTIQQKGVVFKVVRRCR